jgi:hypothetical protein
VNEWKNLDVVVYVVKKMARSEWKNLDVVYVVEKFGEVSE